LVSGTRRQWPRPRRDRDVDNFRRDETLIRLETVSRPRRRDRDHNPGEMGDRLTTIDIMGRKTEGCCVPFLGELGPHLSQCHLDRGLPPYQVASCFIQLFGHNRHGLNSGRGAAVPLSEGELDSHLTQYGLRRGLHPYQLAS